MFALNLEEKKNSTSFLFWSLIWGQSGVGVRGGRGWQWWNPRDQAVPGSGTWKIFLFTTWWEGSDQTCDSPITSPLVPPAGHSVSTQRGPVYREAWEVWGGEILPTVCLGEPDGQMSRSEVRPSLFSAESHRSADGQSYSIGKNWVRPGLSSTLLSNLSFWLIKLILQLKILYWLLLWTECCFPPNSYVNPQHDDIWRLGPLGNNWVWMRSCGWSPQDGIGVLISTLCW